MKLRSFILLILLIAIFATLAMVVFLTIFSGTFRDDFDGEVKPVWSPKTPDKWGIGTEGENSFYRLKEPGEHDDGISRPTEYSLLGDRVYTDFTLKCKVKCDAPTYQRYRDVVVIFGYQDDTHFYYAHFSNISDDLHNAIMLVNGEYRQKLNEDMPEPTLTDLEFHEVKIKRKVETGDIEVHFDGKLVMTANDTTFTSGKIGVGSFDDTGGFDDVYIKGKIVEGGR